MKPRWASRIVVLSSVLLVGMLAGAVASCATNAPVDPAPDDAASSVPEAASHVDAEPADAGADGACDPADEGCITEVIPCERVSWCLVTTPVSPFHTLTAVWGTSKDDVWAVGSGGTIIHYDGSAWSATPSGFDQTFYAVWGSGPNDIWVAHSPKVLLHSTGFEDGVAVWENMPIERDELGLGRPIRAIWGSSASDVRMGSSRFDLWAFGDDLLYFGSGNQFVKSSAPDGGLEWRPIPGKEAITSIWGSSATDVWMLADNGGYERGTTLHGTPWDGGRPNPKIANDPDCYFGCDPDCVGCAVLDDPLVWTPVDSQSSVTLESVWGSSASDVWAVGPHGTIRRIRTGDVRWQKVDSPTTHALHGVWGSGPDDVWMVGDEGTILHYDGSKIEPSSLQLPLGPKRNLRSVWGSGPNDVWIVGDEVALHYTGPKPGGTK